MDREDLANFLRRRREALRPDDVGLPAGRRRRTAGLRREEVAALASMSTDFYARIEQRRGSRPSRETIAALARALRLTLDERDHLFNLAGYEPPPRRVRSDHVTPALLRALDHLDTPAQVTSDLAVTLAQNELAIALLGDHSVYRGPSRSNYYRWFTDPRAREHTPADEHELTSRTYVAELRAVHGRAGEDPEANELVERLLAESPEFAELWERHEVGVRRDTRKRLIHPTVGLLELDCQILTAENETERLVIFTAAPGSEHAERLRLLSVVGNQRFAGQGQDRSGMPS
ncbi:MAG TPA: helix-turn-helix transcriptional regulator [Solirubrobacterales bacterium]|nr:helix-turn-helix transcriptional regulator [Solirubrobacterales bacterium]